VKPGIEKRLENSVALAMSWPRVVLVAVVGGEEYLYSATLAFRNAVSTCRN